MEKQSEKNTSSGPEAKRKTIIIGLTAVFFTALFARLGYLIELLDYPFYEHLFLDPLRHQEWAKSLAAGDWLGKEPFFRAPLYPYFLAVIYKLFGVGPLAPRLIQFLLGTGSAMLTYLLARRLFQKELAALICGLAFALYGPMIYFEGELLIPALIVFLDLAGLLLFMSAREKKFAAGFLISGLVFGLSAIARPNVLLPGLGLSLLLLIERKDVGFKTRFLKRAAPFVAALLLFPALVTVRNMIVGDDLVFIASQGGINFYLGNNRNADGKTAVAPGDLVAAGDEYVDNVELNARAIAEADRGRKLPASAVSSYWYGKARDWIWQDPDSALVLFIKKFFYLLHGHELPSNNSPYFARDYSYLLSALLWDYGLCFPSGLLIPLALLGLVMTWKERKRFAPIYIFTLLYSLTIVMFFVTSRYRMPLIGPLLIFAAAAVLELKSMIIAKQTKKLAVFSGALIFLLALGNGNAFGVKDDRLDIPLGELGNYHLERALKSGSPDTKELFLAEQSYLKAMKENPRDYLSLGNLGSIAYLRGDYLSAERRYREAIALNPLDPALHNNLGQALELRGEVKAAAAEYAAALKIMPDYASARANLRRLQNR